jgi:hypothetical protein
VSAFLRVAAPTRARVLAELAGLLEALPDPLHPLVEQITGLDAEIDAVARDAEGRAVAVRLAGPGEDLAALADLLAQCDWLRPRLPDWLKLNPDLGLRPELVVKGLLLAPSFDPRTVAAARRLGGSDVALARVSAFESRDGIQLALEPLACGASAVAEGDHPGSVDAVRAPRPLAEVGPQVAALESRFRTGLRDEELGLPRRPRSAPRG